jgi:hypothetical protein
MDRRLYFLIPDRQHALAVVDDLIEHGIDREHMHALGDKRTRLDGLPTASLRQRNDTAQRLEKICWNANLASFALALIALIVLSVLYGLNWWLLVPVAIMVTNFMVGLHFTNVPNTHLGEFRDALAHGEILLIVDVPESRVAEVEKDIHHHHPEAAVGGVGWATRGFDL